ncbi:hypothetical protein AB6A40_006353 [Gnathostoma spinigerum]|uniref:Uncharacterized protein n=1 Tax=Gnathostoma spinigerum TaxID=75299 RepID=A0ABD6ENC5_9BILA
MQPLPHQILTQQSVPQNPPIRAQGQQYPLPNFEPSTYQTQYQQPYSSSNQFQPQTQQIIDNKIERSKSHVNPVIRNMLDNFDRFLKASSQIWTGDGLGSSDWSSFGS